MKTATSPATSRTAIGCSSSAKAFAIFATAAVVTIGAALGSANFASAQDISARTIATGSNIPLATDAPDRYTVKRGDTLWDIAKVFLRDPWYWPEIWYVNPQVKNPHLIYPGDVLSLVSKDGKPQVVLTRGPEGTAAEVAVPDNSGTDERARRGNAIRLSPRVHSEPINQSVLAIPYDAVAAFMGKPVLLTKEQIKSAPYVVGVRDAHLLAGEGTDLYARGIRNAPVGARYNIIHVEAPLRDPDNNKVLGYRSVFTSVGVVEAGGDPAKLVARNTVREVLRGDKLFPEEVELNLDFEPHPVPETLHGRIAAVEGVEIAGKYQVVAINRGTKQDLQVGHVFAILQKGDTVVDRYKNGGTDGSTGEHWLFGKRVKLPDERIGVAMIFKTYEHMSYALIMEATRPVTIGDQIAAP